MTYKKPPTYTPDEDALIVARTMSDPEIALALGRSTVAIYSRRRKVLDKQGEIKPRGWTPTPEEIEERKAMVRAMREQNGVVEVIE